MHDKKKELEEADSFIICSAEYNSALPPALTNMLDHYPPAAYKDRPVGKSCHQSSVISHHCNGTTTSYHIKLAAYFNGLYS